MDPAWHAISSRLSFIKQLLPKGDPGAVCFDQLLVAPTGYHTPISTGIRPLKDCPSASHVREFGEMVSAGLGKPMPSGGACDGPDLTVVFVRRENYMAHPRQRGKIVQRMENEEEVLTALQAMASTFTAAHPGHTVHVISGTFSRMTLQEQVGHVQKACVMVGAHGAGLSHILFTRPGSHLLEVQTPGFARPHFRAYAHWAGAQYKVMKAPTRAPDPQAIAGFVKEMLAESV